MTRYQVVVIYLPQTHAKPTFLTQLGLTDKTIIKQSILLDQVIHLVYSGYYHFSKYCHLFEIRIMLYD